MYLCLYQAERWRLIQQILHCRTSSCFFFWWEDGCTPLFAVWTRMSCMHQAIRSRVMRMCCTALRWTCCSWAWRQMNAKMRWTPSRRRNAKWQCTCSWTILRILHSWGIIIQWKHPRNFWARSSVVACRQMQVVYWAAEAAAKVAPNTCQWHANYINKLLNQNGELKLHFWTERGDLRIGIQHSRYVDLQRRRTESVSSPKKNNSAMSWDKLRPPQRCPALHPEGIPWLGFMPTAACEVSPKCP